jgi:hypothetical protein
MKKFVESLLSSNGRISSKRFTAIFALMNLIALTWLAAFYNDQRLVPPYMFDALVILSGGTLAITGAETIFTKKDSNSTVSEHSSETTTENGTVHATQTKNTYRKEEFPSGDDTTPC